MKRKVFKLEIDLQNDVFAEFPVLEIAEILRKLVRQLQTDCTEAAYHYYKNLEDRSGNVVGVFAIKEKTISEVPPKRRKTKEYGRLSR